MSVCKRFWMGFIHAAENRDLIATPLLFVPSSSSSSFPSSESRGSSRNFGALEERGPPPNPERWPALPQRQADLHLQNIGSNFFH